MDETELPQATREALARPLRARDWDGVAAVIAAFVGLLALCVSGYTAYLQRQQVRAQVWPYLEPGMSGNKRELIVFNKGVGPALIEAVQIFVDGKPQKNWSEVFSALGLKYDHHIPYSTLNGVVISPNDHIDQLLFENADDFNRFTAQIKRMHMKLCYCSSLGECWQFDDAAPTGGPSHQAVARCEIPRAEQFLDNENAEPAQPAPPPAEDKKP